jgi:hypothetical protein
MTETTPALESKRAVSIFLGSSSHTVTQHKLYNSNTKNINPRINLSMFDLTLETNPPSLTSGTSGEAPQPPLSPHSDASSTRKVTGSKIIEEAFGGQRKLKLWRGPWWPEVSRYQVALKRVLRPVPHGLTPAGCLRFLGFEKNKATRELFYLAENYERLFEGRIIAVNLATKWILNVCGSSGATKVAGEELNNSNLTVEFQGVCLHYFPVVENSPGDMCKNDELGFCVRIVQDIDKWLSSRPIPDGHTRLFHGTSTSSMNSLLEGGIDTGEFQVVGDFGAGFYCADNVRTAFRFAVLSALTNCELTTLEERYSASLIYFDVENDDLAELNQVELEGDNWTEFTELCLQRKQRFAYQGGRSALELVKGKLVQNPHDVEIDGTTPEVFQDNRKQYAFRKETGNLLLKNPEKMGVAVFDVYMPEEGALKMCPGM